MSDVVATSTLETDENQLMLKDRQLSLRLKELEIRNKEFEEEHRPSILRTSFTSPPVIAAAIAAWATLSAGLITWVSGQITAETQRREALIKAEQDRLTFQTNLILVIKRRRI